MLTHSHNKEVSSWEVQVPIQVNVSHVSSGAEPTSPLKVGQVSIGRCYVLVTKSEVVDP